MILYYKFMIHQHLNSPLQILVEYDDAVWETREWLNVYKDNFHVLAVEKNLVLVTRSGHLQPALSFQLLVDSPGQFKGQKGNKVPVEFLSDLKIDFQDCNRLRVITVSFYNFHWEFF